MKLATSNLGALDERVKRPTYDRDQLAVGIVHFGVGGFHRSHQAMYLDRLMNAGEALEWGICGVGLLPADRSMHQTLSDQNGLYTLLAKEDAGSTEVRIIGSIVQHIYAAEDPEQVLAVLTASSTRIVSLTITEGGYNIDSMSGRFDVDSPAVLADVARRANPRTVFGYITEALSRRRALGFGPFTVMSCDNIESNGDLTRSCLESFAALRDRGLAKWISNEVTFPNSMVDRITPTTTPLHVAELRDEFHVEDAWPVVCEPFTQWVLEDSFAAGRPQLERAGVQLTHDVRPYERMKLRLLNVGHQALAYSGRLTGYTYANEAAVDPVFDTFLRNYMTREALPTLGDVPGIDLHEYIDTLIERFANPSIQDTIARLCAFSSDRIPKWLLPVIRENIESGGEILRSVTIVASWARYAEAVDDRGQPIEIEDALRDDLIDRARRQRDDPLAFIRNSQLFGDLAQEGEFTRVYEQILDSFQTKGAYGTLRNVNGPNFE